VRRSLNGRIAAQDQPSPEGAKTAAAAWTPSWKRVLRLSERIRGGHGDAREAATCLDVAERVRRGWKARRGPLGGFSTEAEGNKGRRWGSGMGRGECHVEE
jgi:hypothetical protein